MAYKPVEDYGIIGDLHTVALVSTEGSIDYMCFPNFDSPTVFGALLDDENGGHFTITAEPEGARLKQMYMPETNVLLSRFLTEDGVGEVMDFMPVGEMRHTHTVVRTVRCVRGPFTFKMECAPRFDYGRAKHTVEEGTDVITFMPEGPDPVGLRLRSPVPVEVIDGDASAEFTLQAGEQVSFILDSSHSSASPAATAEYARRALKHTIGYWRDWLSQSTYDGRWRDMVMRSALALKLLTSVKFGSIAAAATFGLPEQVGGERNWDYRFTWIRDASFTAASLVKLGFTSEAQAFARWVGDRFDESEEPGKLQIMYGIDGRHDLTEQTLDHWSGYRNSAPVRIGNGAYNQLQLDIYGELFYLLDLVDQEIAPVSHDLWADLSVCADWVCDHWQEADEGIWEVRGGRREFLYSRLTDWVALDRALKIAIRQSLPAPLDKWRDQRDAIDAEIYESFWSDKKQAFVQYKGSETLDASSLLMPLVGFISSHDPRWKSTLEGIEEELVDDSLVYRYHPEAAASDGLEGSEGTFCMCSYWFIECLARSGDLERAQFFFEKMHGFSNHLGLYAEEMDATGRYLGNFPQAFTHLALINTAVYLNDAIEGTTRP